VTTRPLSRGAPASSSSPAPQWWTRVRRARALEDMSGWDVRPSSAVADAWVTHGARDASTT